jgi:hypothetical protein
VLWKEARGRQQYLVTLSIVERVATEEVVMSRQAVIHTKRYLTAIHFALDPTRIPEPKERLEKTRDDLLGIAPLVFTIKRIDGNPRSRG